MSLLLLAALIACTPYQNFTRAPGVEVYPATDNVSPIRLLDVEPERGFVTIGYAECLAKKADDALPHLIQQARWHGGQALLNLQNHKDDNGKTVFRADVIRFTEPPFNS
ncbi:MAG TPA: hypothetical protein VFX92_00635 [Candidatus Krumholzibacteria bacterium]|nr:hypothetical protein [Candidatus Krumholzibacteria bacterium]